MQRGKYGLAVVAAIVVGIGLKFYFFSPPVAEAKIAAEAKVASTEITAMQAALTAMHRQQLKDATFVHLDAE
jgi:hypothetical protein